MIPCMYPRSLAVIAAASLAPAASAFGAPMPDHQVRPGQGAGGVRLGMSEAQVIKVLGRPQHRRATRTELGAFVDLAWPGIRVRRWDGAGGRVIHIDVTDRGIRMPNGIGVGSTAAAVRAQLPGAESGSGPHECTLGEPLPGNTVTTIRFGTAGRVTQVSVGRVVG